MTKRSFFSDDELRGIEAAVKSAEEKTSGEIVVLVLPSSGSYRWVAGFWAALGACIATIAVTTFSFSAAWPPSFWLLLEAQLAGVFLGGLVGLVPAVKRFTVPRATAARLVHRECLASFTAAGLHETRDRTGILIALSLLEHRVEILADRGIHGKLGSDYWQSRTEHIVRGIREGRAASAVREVVAQLGTELETHFPRKADDTNEIPNRVLQGSVDPLK